MISTKRGKTGKKVERAVPLIPARLIAMTKGDCAAFPEAIRRAHQLISTTTIHN
jgi:hypothetical protein